MTVRILVGDARSRLKELPDESVHCVVCSPPYFNLRDYLVELQVGTEESPDAYVAALVEIFREVRRILRSDGTCWVNLGDSYSGGGRGNYDVVSSNKGNGASRGLGRPTVPGLKPKDLIGIPWAVAFALRADGWWLRQRLPWLKRSAMPESTRDRPTCAVEEIFLFTKSQNYFYDYEAVQRRMAPASEARLAQDIEAQAGSTRANAGGKTNGPMKAVRGSDKQRGHSRRDAGFNDRWDAMERSEQRATRAFRNSDLFFQSLSPPHGAIGDDDQIIAMDVPSGGFRGEFCRSCRQYFEGDDLRALRTEVYRDGDQKHRRRWCSCGSHDKWLSHFAAFSPDLVEPLIVAGCPEGGTVLDPFSGAGTTGVVSDCLQRDAILIELNPDYAEMSAQRIRCHAPLTARVMVDSGIRTEAAE